MFPTLYKVYEMILLNRLEAFAKQRGFFSEMQFVFQEGVGYIEASFVILETTGTGKQSFQLLSWRSKSLRHGLL